MTPRLQYGTTAKIFHWTIVALLVTQYLIGWLMPDVHRGIQPGVAMTFHVSVGLVILILIVLRFAWRLTHPVSPESSLPAWQRLTSELVHWMLYAMVLLTTLTGWLFASYRGWVGQRFGERHADAGADRCGEVDHESLPVMVGREGGREPRCERRYRSVHQAGETGLDVLQHEGPVPGLVLGLARFRIQYLVGQFLCVAFMTLSSSARSPSNRRTPTSCACPAARV
jgi:cytochrome b561